MKPQRIPPPSQIAVETALRDVFQHGDITAAAVWRGDRDHSTLSRQLNPEEPLESSLYLVERDLDAFYKARYELGAAVWSLLEKFNARYQEKPGERQDFKPVLETFGSLSVAEFERLPVGDRLAAAERAYNELGKYITALRHLDIEAEAAEETDLSRAANATNIKRAG